ncbi:MAG: DUF3124 domain-containing protein [Methylotetracoccus sp.]
MSWLAQVAITVTLALSSGFSSGPASAAGGLRGQTVYVPVYSEISYGERRTTLNVGITLSVRNTDRRNALRIARVDYHSSNGKFIRAYQPEPVSLAPLAAAEYVITGGDRSGGTAASFIVEWDSATPVSIPVIEAVMIGAASMSGVSFTSVGRVLEERP